MEAERGGGTGVETEGQILLSARAVVKMIKKNPRLSTAVQQLHSN